MKKLIFVIAILGMAITTQAQERYPISFICDYVDFSLYLSDTDEGTIYSSRETYKIFKFNYEWNLFSIVGESGKDYFTCTITEFTEEPLLIACDIIDEYGKPGVIAITEESIAIAYNENDTIFVASYSIKSTHRGE